MKTLPTVRMILISVFSLTNVPTTQCPFIIEPQATAFRGAVSGLYLFVLFFSFRQQERFAKL